MSQKSSILSISGANECLWFRLIRTISVEPLLTAFCSMGTSPLLSKACHPYRLVKLETLPRPPVLGLPRPSVQVPLLLLEPRQSVFDLIRILTNSKGLFHIAPVLEKIVLFPTETTDTLQRILLESTSRSPFLKVSYYYSSDT